MKPMPFFKIFSALILAIAMMAQPLLTGCSADSQLDREIDRVVEDQKFSILDWEIEALTQLLDDVIFDKTEADVGNVELVIEYFDNRQTISALDQKLALIQEGVIEGDADYFKQQITPLAERNQIILPSVQNIIAAQIESVFAEIGIINPWQHIYEGTLLFPPVNFVIQSPPDLLVISPRDQITRYKDITLAQGMTDEQKEAIEEEISLTGMSGLIVSLGGIATYPAFVADTMSLYNTIDVAVEEWFHQYLFFRPLGFRYGMHVAGVIHDYEIATVNEALAGMVSSEITSLVWERYYQETMTTTANVASASANEFDFYAEMREIRLAVDEFIENGMIEEAEQYMEERRLYILANGYYIRKLNQAYFAFHGTYASSPGSVSPIGSGLRNLRQQQPSLKDFIDLVSSMTNADEIIAAAD